MIQSKIRDRDGKVDKRDAVKDRQCVEGTRVICTQKRVNEDERSIEIVHSPSMIELQQYMCSQSPTDICYTRADHRSKLKDLSSQIRKQCASAYANSSIQSNVAPVCGVTPALVGDFLSMN